MRLTTTVELTDQQIVELLSPDFEFMDLVEQAKKRLSFIPSDELNDKEQAFLRRIYGEASKEQALALNYVEISKCELCGTSKTYQKYKRSGRYHCKGDYNYDKPIYLHGVDLHKSSVIIKGHTTLGCCTQCWNKLQPHVIEMLSSFNRTPDVNTGVELPEVLRSEGQYVFMFIYREYKERMVQIPFMFRRDTPYAQNDMVRTNYKDLRYGDKEPPVYKGKDIESWQDKTFNGWRYTRFWTVTSDWVEKL